MAFSDLPQDSRLSDGRLQLRHGPIDLVVEAFGPVSEVEAAYQQVRSEFPTVLVELVAELDYLRKQHATHCYTFQGEIAVEMATVAERFSDTRFVTPMIAVAGAVADHMLHGMTSGRHLTKAYVNNGGDIAIYLNDEQSFNLGVCANPLSGTIVSTAHIDQRSDIRGVATSGWRGRSHSLGIADSVTVLARTAATADAAATLIANAIDLPDHPMIQRQAASALQPDSDLGDQMVTIDVGELTSAEVHRALEAGQTLARSMIDAGHITGVYGSLHSQVFSIDPIGIEQRGSRLGVDRLEKELACA